MKLIKEVLFLEKKSKFYGYYFECDNENDIKEIISNLKLQHKKATHVCWAGRIKYPFFERAVDDGEPSGTAGRPILSVLQKKDINNACVVIVRYFGGIKLGAGGLVRAYAKTTSMLL